MGVIKQLPDLVSNQISAGEVIERPASIVKELIENSIDAGSSQILIEIEDGGREKIRIKDDGKGIAEDDIELAFSRFATSKIENVNDLYSIRTLGFRGEALASIASVSKVEINSRSSESLKGCSMELEGGEITGKTSVGIPVGTDITVNNVFFNTPARFKYLKTINTEFGHISSIVTKEALAYPNIQFKLIHNNREVLKTPGTNNLLDTIYAIYGEELVNKLIAIDFEESYVKINGFIAKPEFSRSSRIYELFFVNNRTVYNRSLNRGVEKAYQNILPPGRYPVVFLKLKLNQILVDVNVHPSKKEIKFSREEIIEKIITKGIKKCLSSIDIAPQFKMKKNNQMKKIPTKKTKIFNESINIQKNTHDNRNYSQKNNNNYNKDIQKSKQKDNNNESFREKQQIIDKEISTTDKIGERKRSFNIANNDRKYNTFNKEEKINNKKSQENLFLSELKSENNVDKYPEIIKRILGQIDNTYIIVEGKDGLYIVDQHNAHERILYDRNYEKYNKQDISTQSLIIPVNIELSLEEKEIINKYIDQLDNLGFKIEPFGTTSFIVTEIPIYLKNLPSKQIIRDLIDNLLKTGKTKEKAELIETILKYMSCRAAIKAGKYLDMKEMERLILDLFTTENPNRCPHGRPIIVHLSSEDIDRSMGR